MATEQLSVFLSGHVHGDWRESVRRMAEDKGLPITFRSNCEDHELSDDIGVNIRGLSEGDIGSDYFPRVKDDLGGHVNNLRARVWIARCDVLIAFFDEDRNYKQWNTTNDIAEAARNNKPVIVVHGPNLRHPLKETAARAEIVVDSLEQALEALAYVCAG